MKVKAIYPLPKKQEEELVTARKYTDALLRELKGFIKAVALFGSGARAMQIKEKGDVDILVVFDDLPDRMDPELIRSYLLIAAKIAKKHSHRIHLTHMPLTSFWNYVRIGDPIVINIIRDGIATYDPGFFQPIKALLRRGRIKPSLESIKSYKIRAPASLRSAEWHMLQATIDLYWAVIDAAHAALMHHGLVPVSPDHVAEMIDTMFVKKGTLHKSYATTMKKFFELQDMMHKRTLRTVSGAEYENYFRQATAFVDGMKRIIEA